MSSMLEDLAGTLGGETLGQLSGVLGADDEMVSKGVAAALPALLGGLARNSRQPGGAAALNNALGADHNGSILDSLGAIFGGNAWAQQQANRHGDRILGHVFGDARPRVEQQVQQSSGLSSEMVSKLLPLLAPIVLGYLGRRLGGGGGEAELTRELEAERTQVQQNDNVFGSIIDMLDGDDDDGGGLMDVAGDLLSGPAGRAILGKLLRR